MDRDPATAAEIREQYARQLDAVERLLDLADSALASWKVRGRTHDWIVLIEASRATKSLGAGLLLCEEGYGEQAGMICRAMFEGMAVMYWVVANPLVAVDRFESHDRHTEILAWEAKQQRGWRGADEQPPLKIDPAERAAMTKRFGRHGTKMWTGHDSLRKLLQEIAPQWPTAEARRDLWTHFEIAHRDTNQLLHSSSRAARGSLLEIDEETAHVSTGPDPRMVEQALFSLSYIYVQILRLLMEEYGVEGREEFEALADSWAAFRPGPPA